MQWHADEHLLRQRHWAHLTQRLRSATLDVWHDLAERWQQSHLFRREHRAPRAVPHERFFDFGRGWWVVMAVIVLLYVAGASSVIKRVIDDTEYSIQPSQEVQHALGRQ